MRGEGWGEGGRGDGAGERHAFKTYLPNVHPAVMVTLTCRIPYSDDGQGAKCEGHTFTSGKGHKGDLKFFFAFNAGLMAFQHPKEKNTKQFDLLLNITCSS